MLLNIILQESQIPEWLVALISAMLVFLPNLILAIVQIRRTKQDAKTSESSSAKVIAEAVDILIQPLKDRVSELTVMNSTLLSENARLKVENSQLQSENAILASRITRLESEVGDLRFKVCELQKQPTKPSTKPRTRKAGDNEKEC